MILIYQRANDNAYDGINDDSNSSTDDDDDDN